MIELKPGMVVYDSWGRLGIITKRAARPSEKWLQVQEKLSEEERAEQEWYSVQPMTGGAAVTARCATTFVRNATLEDFQECHRNANPCGRDTLKRLVQDVIAKAT
jgi:hypothetical protein